MKNSVPTDIEQKISVKVDQSGNGSALSINKKARNKQNFMEGQELRPPPPSRFDHDSNALSEQGSARYLAKLGTRCIKSPLYKFVYKIY